MNVSPLDLRQPAFNTALQGLRQDRGHLVPHGGRRRLRAGAARNRPAPPGRHQAGSRAQRAPRAREEPEDDADDGAEAGGRHHRRTPKEEAKRVVRDAQGRSELLLEKTQARLEDVQREIDGLKLKRRDVETSIEATIQTLRNTLEFVREQDARDREDRLLLHRPRVEEADRGASRKGVDTKPVPLGGVSVESSRSASFRI